MTLLAAQQTEKTLPKSQNLSKVNLWEEIRSVDRPRVKL